MHDAGEFEDRQYLVTEFVDGGTLRDWLQENRGWRPTIELLTGVARLAVDQSAQGQGLGLQLLRFVLRLALQMADDYGCVGVVVDAKPDAEAFYAKYGFVAVEAVEGGSDARPAPTPMFLSIRAIRDAVGKSSLKGR